MSYQTRASLFWGVPLTADAFDAAIDLDDGAHGVRIVSHGYGTGSMANYLAVADTVQATDADCSDALAIAAPCISERDRRVLADAMRALDIHGEGRWYLAAARI